MNIQWLIQLLNSIYKLFIHYYQFRNCSADYNNLFILPSGSSKSTTEAFSRHGRPVYNVSKRFMYSMYPAYSLGI